MLDCRLIILATLLQQVQPWIFLHSCMGQVIFLQIRSDPYSHMCRATKNALRGVLMLMSKTRMLCAHCLRGNRRRRLTMGNRFRSSNNEINYRIVYRWSPSRPFISFIFSFVSRMIMTLLDTNSIALKQPTFFNQNNQHASVQCTQFALCSSDLFHVHSLLRSRTRVNAHLNSESGQNCDGEWPTRAKQ